VSLPPAQTGVTRNRRLISDTKYWYEANDEPKCVRIVRHIQPGVSNPKEERRMYNRQFLELAQDGIEA
jgi:hypothetical protein